MMTDFSGSNRSLLTMTFSPCMASARDAGGCPLSEVGGDGVAEESSSDDDMLVEMKMNGVVCGGGHCLVVLLSPRSGDSGPAG